MRSFLLSTILFLVGGSAAVAQESYSGDAAAAYHWVRTNAGPGECGCFGMNGGGLSGSWNFRGPWFAVVDISAEHSAPADRQFSNTHFVFGRGALQNPAAVVGRKT